MLQDQYRGITIDLCRHEHGIWLDSHELDQLREHVAREDEEAPASPPSIGQDPAKAVTGGTKTCPVCDVPLVPTIDTGGRRVELDICYQHGVWVDAGELAFVEGRDPTGASTDARPAMSSLRDRLAARSAASGPVERGSSSPSDDAGPGFSLSALFD